jgi:hypothetical protein
MCNHARIPTTLASMAAWQHGSMAAWQHGSMATISAFNAPPSLATVAIFMCSKKTRAAGPTRE